MANLLYLNQFITTTLSVVGGINDSTTTGIVMQSNSGVDTSKPGIAVLTYADPLDMDNAEFIEYSSINSTTNTFVGVTRGAEGYSAKSHNNGATIAFPVSESHINRLANALSIGGVATNGVTTTKDEDDMASDSATALATQQSIKAYVDNTGGGEATAKARAHLGSNQSLANNDKVELDTKDYDPGSNFDSTTDYDFTAPADGFYQVVGQIAVVPASGNRYGPQIRVNGTTVAATLYYSNGAAEIRTVVSDIVQLSANDLVTFHYITDDGTNRTVAFGPQKTYMAIHLLST